MNLLPPSSPVTSSGSRSSNRPSIGVFVSTIIASCAKQASRVSKKIITTTKPSNSKTSPVRSKPAKLLSNIKSSKASLLYKKKVGKEEPPETCSDLEFGDGGIWQRSIMMGDKCQPPDFPGVIYYDSNGKQVSDCPFRSPRASPLPSYAYKKSRLRNEWDN